MAVIYLGSSAIDRPGNTATSTLICKESPASASAYINVVEIWCNTNLSGCIVATFYNTGGNDFTARDSHAIGTVTAGGKRTFSGLSLLVHAGDYIGVYFSGGSIETNTSGSQGRWVLDGDRTSGSATFTYNAGFSHSLRGTATFYEYVGTGTFTYSGTVVQSHSRNYLTTASGQLTYSGSAIQAYSRDYLYEGSGVVTFSGAATCYYSSVFFYVGSGACNFSGIATAFPGFIFAGSGGAFTYSGLSIYEYWGIFYLVDKPTIITYTVTVDTCTWYISPSFSVRTWLSLANQGLKTWAALKAAGLTTWKKLGASKWFVTFYYMVPEPSTTVYVVPNPSTTFYEVST